MPNPAITQSEPTRQLIADMEALAVSTPRVDRWGMTHWKLAAEFEREKERTRILSGYIVSLLDRVEQLERNSPATPPQSL